MPATSWILACYIIGSAAGSAGVTSVAAGSAVAVLCIARMVRRSGRLAILATVALALAAGARATAIRWREAHCRALLMRSSQVEVVADFDADSGGMAPARFRPHRGGCETTGRIRARVGVRGGIWLRTASRPEPSRAGLVVTIATVTPTGDLLRRAGLRAAGVRRVDSTFAGDAPMARALLLADMHLIDPEMRQRWARAGLVHLLSVSGVHVAIIAGALLLLGSALRLSLRAATLASLALTAGYVVVLGLPPPAVRAAVMFGSVMVARLRQRPASPWSVLVLGALIPVLADAAAPLDLGWQLSVLGVVALAASARLVRRVGWSGGGWRGSLRREFVASVVASLASAPLIAWHFGTISLIAPAANIVVAPLVTVLQPTLFLALACSPWPAVARFVAGAVHPLLALIDGVAVRAAAPTWAATDLTPTLNAAVLGGVVSGALLAAMVRRDAGPALLAAAGSVVVLVWSGLGAPRGSGRLELHMLDVGQGDAIAVRTPRGRWVVVDAGGGAPGLDRGRRTVLPYLRRIGGPLEAFVLSHPHLDHVGGAPALLGRMPPARYLDGAFAGATAAYRASLESAAVHRVRWQRVHPGDTLDLDGVTFRFLAPDSSWTAGLDDANLASTVLRVEFGRIAMLLVGDAEIAEEDWLLQHVPPAWLRADVLKVGHHGSRTSSGSDFLDAVRPRVALVSVGRGNSYGHPSPEVVAEYARRSVPLLRTDVAGTTVVSTDGRDLVIATAARAWTLSSPALPRGSGTGSSAP
ncbi:MAG: DNA internalization-related competence protein ComEC/Rec2 [Gemmatimonadaceae bacterium]|nr:DNA internalization-related competence protein ComEC/Rec2 [Gemmatimonadaceae bacterium]